MIQKSDGGYTYDSTDLAAMDYRFNKLAMDKVIIFTDIGQKDHFTKIFRAAKISGFYNPDSQTPTHLGLGLMLGEDGGKIKSRSGDSIKLSELLDEATLRAKNLLLERQKDPLTSSHLQGENLDQISEKLAINSIKYFDLKQLRASSYKFSYKKMLDTKGNTGVYITYMYARICSIISKSSFGELSQLTNDIQNSYLESPENLQLHTPEEINLALAI